VRRITEGAYRDRAAALQGELARYDSPAIVERSIVGAGAAVHACQGPSPA
jgi:hypothetical protein